MMLKQPNKRVSYNAYFNCLLILHVHKRHSY